MAINNLTLADFRTQVKRRLNEESNDGLWTSDELDRYINRATLRVHMDTLLVKTETNLSFVQDVSMYDLSTNNMRAEFLYSTSINNGRRLGPTNFLSMDKMWVSGNTWERDASSVPRNFIPFNWDRFVVWPPPATTPNVTLRSVPYPVALTVDTDTTVLPFVGQKLIVIFAAFLAQMKNDVKIALGILKEYQGVLEPLRATQRHNEMSRPAMMVPGQQFDREQANPGVNFGRQITLGLR